MEVLKAIIAYRKLSDQSLLERGNFISQKITNNPHFPVTTPAQTVVVDTVADFGAAVIDAGSGDTLLVAIKNQKKALLASMLVQLSNCVLMVANGDRVIAQSSGIELARPRGPRAPLGPPANFSVVNGNQPGMMIMSTDKVPGAVSYSHQYTTDPTLKEDTFISMNCTQRRCVITNLVPGTMYYFRTAAIGTKEQVMYSVVISKIAS